MGSKVTKEQIKKMNLSDKEIETLYNYLKILYHKYGIISEIAYYSATNKLRIAKQNKFKL